MEAVGNPPSLDQIRDQVRLLSPEEQKKVLGDIHNIDKETTRFVWRWVVGAFSICLLLAVGALVLSMFIAPTGQTNGQTILAVFTSVVGFLSGLLIQSPIQAQSNTVGKTV